MTMQAIINSAQAIEVNRTKLIAHSMSRNGKLLVASRNWVNPWRFTVTPKPVWIWADSRTIFETVVNADRYTAHTFTLGQGASSWITDYQGDLEVTDITNGILAQSVSNNQLVIRAYGDSSDANTVAGKIWAAADAFVVFAAGDIIQVVDNDYPHAITASVTRADGTFVDPDGTFGSGDEYYEFTIPLHRGYLGSTAVTGKNLKVGSGCTFKCIATQMPSYRHSEYGRVEFNGSIELMEFVE